MKHEKIDGGGLAYASCRYGMSRIMFRGPKRRLDQPYLAFLGGTETYGKFIDRPFPDLVEKAIGRRCVNFGCVNGGVDAFVNDATIMAACNGADLTVVQVMGANFLSNRFYSVHPRRNDRFLQASTVLKAIYPEVDFSEFTFTRAMLSKLYGMSAERFEIVIYELRQAWVARMRNMLGQIGPNAVLLWFSRHDMTDDHWTELRDPLKVDPLFVTRSMIDELRPLVREVIVSIPSEIARRQGTTGMYFSAAQRNAAFEMLGVACHVEVSHVLAQRLKPLIA